MKSLKLFFAAVCILSCITIGALDSPVAQIQEQSKKIEQSETELKNTIEQLKGVHDDLIHSVNEQIQKTIETTIDSQIGSLQATQEQLNMIPKEVLTFFDPNDFTGLGDTKRVVALIIEALEITKNTLRGVQSQFAGTIKQLEYNPNDPASVYYGLEGAIKQLHSAGQDLNEMAQFVQKIGL